MIKKKYFKIKRIILNYLIHHFTYLYRPSSAPYISGDTFRSISDHIYDESKKLNPKKVKKNDIVFVSSDLVNQYFKKIHKKIENKYILISHNSDKNITEKEKEYLDDKVIYWFAQNLSIKQDEKLGVIPIGLENLRYHLNGELGDFVTKTNIVKKNMVLASFSVSTNQEVRENLLNLSKNKSFIEIKKFLDHKTYFENLKLYKFNLCPEGNGLDTHRIWESVLAESIPIMVRNFFTINLALLKFPILLLDDWSDLNNLTNDYLNHYYLNQFQNFHKSDVLKIDYWLKEINNKKL